MPWKMEPSASLRLPSPAKTDWVSANLHPELIMAKGNNSHKKETKKPKKEKPKAPPSTRR